MRLALLLLVLAALLSWARFAIGDAQLIAGEGQVNRAVGHAPRAAKARIPARADALAAEPQPMSGAPLFRPLQAPPAPEAPKAGETFALVGIVMREETRVAFLRDTVDGRSYTASPGADMAGWRVERIDARCVALKRRRRTQDVCL